MATKRNTDVEREQVVAHVEVCPLAVRSNLTHLERCLGCSARLWVRAMHTGDLASSDPIKFYDLRRPELL